MSVMLYRHPGKHKLHGDMFDYIVVDENEVDSHLCDGWFLSTTEALVNLHHKTPQVKRSFIDLTDDEINEIGTQEKAIADLSEEYNVTQYCVRKCRHAVDQAADN